jgi:hypothetical protein
MPVRALPLIAALVSLVLAPASSEAQLLKKIQRKVTEAKGTIADARSVRCEVQGVCGEVWKAETFAPGAYETLAVAVFDATRRYGSEDMQGLARDPFEGGLIENGFLLAASTETRKVQQRIGGGTEEWTDERLAQLKDFITNIDAVLVVDIRQLQIGRCTLEKDGRNVPGTSVTVSLSARWLNVDVGDVPWVARHSVSVCEDGGPAALSTALGTVAAQLATNLPVRGGS